MEQQLLLREERSSEPKPVLERSDNSIRSGLELAFLVVFLLVVAVQAFGSRPFGLADNGDFPKVLARISAWPLPDGASDKYSYLVTDYQIDPSHFWDSHLPTIELFFAKIAKQVGSLFVPEGHFDLRSLGVIHLLLLACGVWFIIRSMRRLPLLPAVVLSGLAVLIFADIEYTQFLNTAFMDAGSIVCVVLLFAIALLAFTPDSGPLSILFFGAVASMFLGSKIQHVICVIPLLLACSLLCFRRRQSRPRLAWLASIVMICGTSIYMLFAWPATYQYSSLFNVVFLKLTVLDDSPEAALQEFGRPSSDLRYVGTHAYQPDSPVNVATYREQFSRDVTESKLIKLYLEHPGIAAKILVSDLRKAGKDIPVSEIPVGLSQKTFAVYGTYRRVDDTRPGQRPQGLDLWSSGRRFLASQMPFLMPLMLIATLAISVYRFFDAGAENVGSWAALFLVTSFGIIGLLTGSLADATDTSRHIVLYQVCCDFMLLLLLQIAASSRFVKSHLKLPSTHQPNSLSSFESSSSM